MSKKTPKYIVDNSFVGIQVWIVKLYALRSATKADADLEYMNGRAAQEALDAGTHKGVKTDPLHGTSFGVLSFKGTEFYIPLPILNLTVTETY